MTFRARHPAAWLYHHNTIRWPFNVLEPDDGAPEEPCFKEYPRAPCVALPAPRALVSTLDAAIERRVSCRTFGSAALELDALATVLARAYGVHGVTTAGSREHLERPVPSGGALYPLELYVLARRVRGLAGGVHHYAPLHHALEQATVTEQSDAFVRQVFMDQPYVVDAAAILVLTAVVDRTLQKYGERGYRYVLLEAGHVAQNVCLVAAALDLGALPLGGFFDAWLARTLDVDLEREIVLYAVALGPSSVDAADRAARRDLPGMLGG